MRTNKRKLYESIMKDVSKTVKKHLDENYVPNFQEKYFVIEVTSNEPEAELFSNLNQLKKYLLQAWDAEDVDQMLEKVKNLNTGECTSWGENSYVILGKV